MRPIPIEFLNLRHAFLLNHTRYILIVIIIITVAGNCPTFPCVPIPFHSETYRTPPSMIDKAVGHSNHTASASKANVLLAIPPQRPTFLRMKTKPPSMVKAVCFPDTTAKANVLLAISPQHNPPSMIKAIHSLLSHIATEKLLHANKITVRLPPRSGRASTACNEP
jgi:hypothetical protein